MEKEDIPAAGDETAACFDCSICLEPAGEPVVTLCGHLYCRPCVRRWLRSCRPTAQGCPVCKAAVSEDRLVPLYGHAASGCDVNHRQNGGDGDLCFDEGVQPMDCVQRQHYGGSAMDHRGWVLHSNAGRVNGSAAVAVLPWAFPSGRLPLPPRLVIACDERRQRRVDNSLNQIWFFLAVSALLCFLLF